MRKSISWLFLIFVALSLSSSVNCLGSDDSLTQQELELVSEFRTLVKDIIYKDYMHEDGYLVRFLRGKTARNYNLAEAKEMITNAMNWRKQNKIDTILTEDFSEIEKEFSFALEGFDNYGRPMAFVNFGLVDVRKITISGKLHRVIRFFISLLEFAEVVAREINLQTGSTNITRAYIWIDLAGFNLRQHACVQCLQLLPPILTAYENYYPDRIYRVHLLNTPRIFLPIYEIARPFLSSRSRAAIRLFDHDADKWKKVLASEVPQDQLSSAYGGTRQVSIATLAQQRKSNPFVKAAYEKAFDELRKNQLND